MEHFNHVVEFHVLSGICDRQQTLFFSSSFLDPFWEFLTVQDLHARLKMCCQPIMFLGCCAPLFLTKSNAAFQDSFP